MILYNFQQVLNKADRSYKNLIKTALYLSICFIVLCAFSLAEAAVFDDAATGNWADGATWGNTSPGTVGVDYPGASDTVTIDGYTVTLAAGAACGNITIGGGGTLDAAGYTITSGGEWLDLGTFTHGNGTVILTGADDADARLYEVNFYNLTIDTNASGSVIRQFSPCVINNTLTVIAGGTFNLNDYGMTVNGTIANSGTIRLAGNVDPANMTVPGIGTSGTVVYSGTADYTTTPGALSLGNTYYNLTFNGVGGSWTPNAAVNVGGDFTITAGTFDTGGYSVDVAGNWSNSDTFTSGSNTVTFDGTGAQSITSGGSSFYNVDISNTSNTVSLSDALVLLTNGTLTIDANTTLYLNGNNLTVPTTFANDGTLQLQGGETTVSITNMDIDTGTVTYAGNGDGTQDTHTIKDFGTPDYYNLTINDANATKDIFQLGAGLGVAGDLAVTSGTFDYNSQAVTLSGAGNSYTIGTNGIVTGSGGTTNISGIITYTDGTGGSQNLGTLVVD